MCKKITLLNIEMANLLGRIDKKQILLEREQSILKEIKYYEKRIEDAKNAKRDTSCYESDSSESDFEFTIDNEPSIVELMQKQKMLKTCLLATEELTNVSVVQSEVNILPDDPVLEGELPISEVGVWKEVIAECRIGVVPFSINFYAHQGTRPFAPISYRNLQVLLVKKSHGVELSKSVLPNLKRPADAIEVIRSYAEAFRSRRTTLAKLAEKYADSLFMEPKAEGGYALKCANILEISWTLENKHSPLARFQHRMSIDLDYIDESYLRIIDKANKQLSNPSLLTENRTLLLSTIIDTCLEAQGITNDSHNSETESDKLKPTTSKTQVTTQHDINLMAPPKSIPKKTKKNKDIAKRPNTDTDDVNSKRPKINNENILKTTEKSNADNKKTTDGAQNKKTKTANNVASDKNVQNVENKKRSIETTEKDQNKRAKTVLNENDSSGKKTSKNIDEIQKSNLVNKKGNVEIMNSNNNASAKNLHQNSKVVTQTGEKITDKTKKNKTDGKINNNSDKLPLNKNNIASTIKVIEQSKNKERNKIHVPNSKLQNLGHTEMGKSSSQQNKENIINNKLDASRVNVIQKNPAEKVLKKVINQPITSKKTVENVASKQINTLNKAPNLNKQAKNLQHSNEKNKAIKNVVSNENSKYVKRNSFSSKIKLLNTQKKRKSIGVTSNTHDANVKSKIPQKKVSNASEGSLKKNTLRISPRKMATQMKTVKAQLSIKTLKPTSIPVAKRVY